MCKLEFGFSNFRKLGFVKKGHVVSVAVLDDHRGNGLGKALMLEGINGVLQRKADEIYLEVRASNTGAIKMYEKLKPAKGRKPRNRIRRASSRSRSPRIFELATHAPVHPKAPSYPSAPPFIIHLGDIVAEM